MKIKKTIRTYDNTLFDWTDDGGFTTLARLGITRAPQKFYITDVDDETNEPIKLRFDKTGTIKGAWVYNAPWQSEYSDFEGAEVIIYKK